jgi:hypothetical protein
MSKIVIGKSGSRNFAIDLPTFIPTRGLVTSDSGGGKSWLLRRIIEQAFGKIQIIVIDYEGEFSTLREKLDFVIAAPGGETPADVRSAALLAQRALEFRFSLIADIYEMKPSDRHKWVRLFLESLIDAPKKFWHPVLVIVDEAHVFCPEHGKGESEASEAMIALCTRGRKRGFAALWASQRLATVNKDATSMLLNRMIGPTFEDVNRKRAAEVLGVPEGKKDRAPFFKEIQLLEPGYFYCLGRAISRERVLVRVGPVETTHPETGTAARSYEPPPPSAKIKALLPQLSDLPKTAEEKSKNEAELRREIRELKASLRQQPKPPAPQKQEVRVADPRAIERAIAPLREALEAAMKILVKVQVLNTKGSKISDEEIRKALEATVRDVRRLAEGKIDARARELDHLKAECGRLIKRIEQVSGKHSRISIDATAAISGAQPIKVSGEEIHRKGSALESKDTQAKSSHPRPEVSHAESNGDSELTGPQRRILKAIAEFEAIGRTQISKAWIAARSGASYTSSSYGNNLGFLRSSGYIAYPGPDQVALTDKGRESAGAIEPPSSSEEMLKSCLDLLSSPQQKILQTAYERYPTPLAKDELAELVGVSAGSSSYGNNLGALRSAGMIEYSGPGQVKAADWLFLE